METIDINKVAGLQALDSEGNVLGVVSMEQLTDMVAGKLATELSSQRTTLPAMQTVTPMAASVAATGVDKTESQLGDVTDPGYVRVIDKTGNSGKQGIEQFASVVGGLLPITTLSKAFNYIMHSFNSGALTIDANGLVTISNKSVNYNPSVILVSKGAAGGVTHVAGRTLDSLDVQVTVEVNGKTTITSTKAREDLIVVGYQSIQ